MLRSENPDYRTPVPQTDRQPLDGQADQAGQGQHMKEAMSMITYSLAETPWSHSHYIETYILYSEYIQKECVMTKIYMCQRIGLGITQNV